MASRSTRRRILGIVETDATFAPVELREGAGYEGKCIHCSGKLHVLHDGTPVGEVTIEHIVPRARGGLDDPENLALACARCNHLKGARHDDRVARPRALEIEQRLLARRRERWRAPAPPVAIEIDGILDLHTFAPEDVKPLMSAYLEACRSRGLAEARVIHGKGTGSLRRSVRALLDATPEVLAYRSGREDEGGWGVTVVSLRTTP